MAKKAVFLDRDGVLNIDAGTYTFELDRFILDENVPEALELLKKNGFQLIVITNQAGIAKGMYTSKEMKACHQKLQSLTNNAIDHFYYSPYHPNFTNSLSRKPESLLFEKAIARFDVDVSQSWMVGDKERDLMPAKKMGINQLVLITQNTVSETIATHQARTLFEATENYILT